VSIDCLCAGILVADHVCEPLDRLPAAGELMITAGHRLSLGGCASNMALDLARLGAKTGVAGCVGDDLFGRFIEQTLRDGGANTDGVRRLPDVATASTMVINVRGEDRRFITAVGANVEFQVGHIPADWLDRAKVLYVGGYFMMPSVNPDELRALFANARARGARTVLDVVLLGGESNLDDLARVLPETDVFLPNEDEAAMLLGETEPLAQAEQFRRLGAGTVVITRGGEGALLLSEDERLRCGIYDVELIGGTGAGDAFDAGYCFGLLEGEDPAGCLRWGSALGASCVRSAGATDSVFTREEADAFMRDHPLTIERF